jgi:predicted MFS family arabinose efflux permease
MSAGANGASPDASVRVRRVLTIASFASFSGALFFRALDPVIPQVSQDLAVAPETAALLAAAFAFPYGFIQPVLGPVADFVGKPKVMTACLVLLIAMAVVGMFTPSFPVLFASRMLAGAACGGLFPVAMALVGDLVPVGQRQLALARLLAATITGSLLSSAVAGVVADIFHWRAIFIVFGCVGVVALATAIFGFRDLPPAERQPVDFWALPQRFRTIFADLRARTCSSAVALEGIFLFGLFPYVALLLYAAGEERASIAGIVIAFFAVGGVIYSFCVRWMLKWFGQRRVMQGGGALMALGLTLVAFAPPWPVQCLAFLVAGMGFYMLHGSIQVYVTEIAPSMRSSGVAFHSFSFFGGQAIGPVVFGFGLATFGATPSVLISAVALALIGFVTAHLLTRRARPLTHRDDADASP